MKSVMVFKFIVMFFLVLHLSKGWNSRIDFSDFIVRDNLVWLGFSYLQN